MKRFVQPELLDTMVPDDPRAIRSRHDLCRVNGWMGNHSIMAGALKKNFGAVPSGPIIDIGAGDGNFLLDVARKLTSAWAGVHATLLDRQMAVAPATLAAFKALRWELATMKADVFDWPPSTAGEAVVLANLFLHHFEDDRLAELLQIISRNARFFIAIEPRRLAMPELGGILLALIGCNGVTRHDGVVSIRAGFVGRDISELWPDKSQWQLTEKPAGPFSHLFVARRFA